jgi:ketosteroid isomerase-like protein
MDPTTDPESHPSGRGHASSEQRILRMTPDREAATSTGAVIRGRIDALAQAIRAKDLAELMTFYARDVEVFDVRSSRNVPGAAAYRNNFEHWFASFQGPLGFELHNLRVVPGDNAAFCHYLALVTGERPGGRTSGYWVRGTTCLERREGEWLVTHEHISMPAG